MRKPVVSGALGGAVLGAGLAVAGVRAAYWWVQDDRVATFDETYREIEGVDGPYNSDLSVTFDPNWARILVPAAVGGAVVGLLLGFLVSRLGRRTGTLLISAAVSGAVLGLVGVLASYGWQRHEAAPRRYVDYLPAPISPEWTRLLLPAAVTGAVLGLVIGAVAYALSRRSARRAARSA